jgi:hypothetical protein
MLVPAPNRGLTFSWMTTTFSTFMVNDMPDSTRFFPVVGGLIEAAIRVEQLWDEVGKTFGVDILWVCLEQLSRRGRRFAEHLCGTLTRLFAVRSRTQF